MRERILTTLFLVSAVSLWADPATGWLQTAAGTYDYYDTANWVDGQINGIFGSDLTLTGNQKLTFSQDTTLTDGLTFQFAGGFTITFASDDSATPRVVTLGDDLASSSGTTNAGVAFDSSLIVDLGNAERTITSSNGNFTYSFNGTIQNGALALNNAGWVNLSGDNTYAGGTTTLANGGVSFNSSTAFGTGTITFNAPNTTLQCDATDRTLVNNNPIVLNGNINAALNTNRSRNLGFGEITILKPITISVGKNVLLLPGPIAEDSPYGLEAITKTGAATLVTADDLTVGAEGAILDVQAGTWRFDGIICGEGTLTKTGDGTLVLNHANSLVGELMVQGGVIQPKKSSRNKSIDLEPVDHIGEIDRI